MAHFNNDDLEYVVDDYFHDFEDDSHIAPQRVDSDFEDDDEFLTSNAKTDTTASEARNGKDIQGIPWERLNYTRDQYRETRLKQYKNYQNLSRSPSHLHKHCLQVQNGKTFYDFHFNTRLVKSTIVHFQFLKQVESEQLGRTLYYDMIGKCLTTSERALTISVTS